MASRFWVGGTGTWDSSTTTNWAASSGGAGGQSVPGSSDTVTFDGSSGGGTVTLNFGGTITIQSLTLGSFTGTFDNSVNNNNFTITANGACFVVSGSGTRTIKLGSATYTLNNTTGPTYTASNTTGLTLQASSATIAFTGAAAVKSFTGGNSQTYGTVSFAASTGSGRCLPANTFTTGTLTVTAPNLLVLGSGVTTTVSTTLNLAGSSGSEIGVVSDVFGSTATMAIPAAQTATWCAFRDVTFSGNTLTATSSFDLGHNSGVTISAPSGGGGSGPSFSASIF